MNIEFCKPAVIAEDLSDAKAVLQTIAEMAVNRTSMPVSEKELFTRLQDRERIASTAIGHGIAIPHCLVDGMQSFTVGLLLTRPGVSFNAPGKDAVDLFFFIVSPPEARTRHLQILAAISRAVRDEAFRTMLREAESGEALSALLEERITFPQDTQNENPCRFRAYIQDPDLVESVIEDLSAFGAGSLLVYECENASSYLGQVPLFAGLWSSRDDTRIRVIEGVVQKEKANELVRRVADQTEHKPGILVTVEALLSAHGSLEL